MPMIGGHPCVRYPDISLYQGIPDMGAVANSRDGLVHKASEGIYITDPCYRQNIGNWRRATNKPGGAYLWVRPGQDGRQQVERFLAATDGDVGPLIPTLDVEQAGLAASTVDQVIQALYDHGLARWLGPTGEWVPCRIYTGAFFRLADMPTVAKPDDWRRFDLWVAAYPRYEWIDPDPTQLVLPSVTGPWVTWSAWQFAGGNGRQPGVIGECDQSVEKVESFVRATNPGGSSNMPLNDDDKAAIKAIVDAEVEAAKAEMLGTFGGWEGDTRRYLGRQAIRLDQHNEQFYIADGPTGAPVKVHIPNPEVLACLQGTGYIDALPERVLTPDSPEGQWFAALPVVEG